MAGAESPRVPLFPTREHPAAAHTLKPRTTDPRLGHYQVLTAWLRDLRPPHERNQIATRRSERAQRGPPRVADQWQSRAGQSPQPGGGETHRKRDRDSRGLPREQGLLMRERSSNQISAPVQSSYAPPPIFRAFQPRAGRGQPGTPRMLEGFAYTFAGWLSAPAD